jgi:hypothetical protein
MCEARWDIGFIVPNRARRRNLSFGSLIIRHTTCQWAEDQLSMIAVQLNADLVSIAKEPINKSDTIGGLRSKELPELLPFQFVGRDFIIKVIAASLSLFRCHWSGEI